MDTSNLDTHMYLLVPTTSSWLENKQVELMKQIHTFNFFSFLSITHAVCLGYFHIPANLYGILGPTK